MSELEQVSSVKTLDQYKRIYVPDKILQALELEVGDNLVWMHDSVAGEYLLERQL